MNDDEKTKAIKDYFHNFYVITWWELIHSQWGYTREDWVEWWEMQIKIYLLKKIFCEPYEKLRKEAEA